MAAAVWQGQLNMGSHDYTETDIDPSIFFTNRHQVSPLSQAVSLRQANTTPTSAPIPGLLAPVYKRDPFIRVAPAPWLFPTGPHGTNPKPRGTQGPGPTPVPRAVPTPVRLPPSLIPLPGAPSKLIPVMKPGPQPPIQLGPPMVGVHVPISPLPLPVSKPLPPAPVRLPHNVAPLPLPVNVPPPHYSPMPTPNHPVLKTLPPPGGINPPTKSHTLLYAVGAIVVLGIVLGAK